MGKMSTMYMHFTDSKTKVENIYNDIWVMRDMDLKNFEEIRNSAQGCAWRGDAANAFYEKLDNWIRDFKQYLNHLGAVANRVELEIGEWVDRDVSYHYSPESFAIESAGTGSDEIPSQTLEHKDGDWSFKISLKELWPGELPWQWRLPSEYNTFTGLFGSYWVEETTNNILDAGFFIGWDKEKGLGAGFFGEYTLFEKLWTTILFGVPLSFGGNLFKIDAAGGKAGAEIGGLTLFDIAGLFSVKVNAGFGLGADSKGAKLGIWEFNWDLPEIIEAVQELEFNTPPAMETW